MGASFHPGPRFRRPPCDPGRWAFPSPVLTLALPRSPFHTARSLSADSHTPRRGMVCFHGRSIVHRPSSVRVLLEPPSAQSPFARARCYLAPWSHGPRQQAFPCLHRSYGLMRQSSPLLVPRCHPRTPGLCRLRSAPAGRRTFPTLSLRLLSRVLGPLPRRLLRGRCPFLPPRHRPSPRRTGSRHTVRQRFPYGALLRLQSSLHVQAAGGLTTQVAPTATPRRMAAVVFRPSLSGLFPPRGPGYAGRLNRPSTAEDFHLIRCAALSAAPESRRRAAPGRRSDVGA